MSTIKKAATSVHKQLVNATYIFFIISAVGIPLLFFIWVLDIALHFNGADGGDAVGLIIFPICITLQIISALIGVLGAILCLDFDLMIIAIYFLLLVVFGLYQFTNGDNINLPLMLYFLLGYFVLVIVFSVNKFKRVNKGENEDYK